MFNFEILQTLLGTLVIHILKARKTGSIGLREVWTYKKGFGSISLGRYIIVIEGSGYTTVKHEYGHCLQSAMFGPFYLLLVGIPSLLGNIWDRIAHKNWPQEKRIKWYYSRWPEAQADKLGEVER